MEAIHKWMAALVAAAVLSGCAGKTETVNRDGPAAREALSWYQEILTGDTAAAHARLHPDAARKVTQAVLDRKVRIMVTRWALENPEVFVTSSQERQESAVVHVAIRGNRKGGKTHRITDGVTLKPMGNAWRIWMNP